MISIPTVLLFRIIVYMGRAHDIEVTIPIKLRYMFEFIRISRLSSYIGHVELIALVKCAFKQAISIEHINILTDIR